MQNVPNHQTDPKPMSSYVLLGKEGRLTDVRWQLTVLDSRSVTRGISRREGTDDGPWERKDKTDD